MNRRRLSGLGLALGAGLGWASLMAGCGFKLRGDLNFAFATLTITPATGGTVANDLRRALATRVQLIEATPPGTAPEPPQGSAPNARPLAQVVLDILSEQREKTVVGVNATGQVREFQLRIRVKFRLRSRQGKALIPETEILQQRDISFNESAVLAKEAEENLLYRDMQADIVQQMLRRLAAIHDL